MTTTFLWIGVGWFVLAGGLCLVSASWLKNRVMELLSRLTKPESTLDTYSLITLPGFVAHEGAHALAALVLGVPIKGINLIPQRVPRKKGEKKGGPEEVAASVQVGAVGPLRMAVVALAPFFIGAVVLGVLAGVGLPRAGMTYPWARLWSWVQDLFFKGGGGAGLLGVLWIVVRVYLLWAIASHMAPSRVDLRYVPGGLVVLAVLLLIGGVVLPNLGLVLDFAPLVPVRYLNYMADGLFIGAALNVVVLLVVLAAGRWLRRPAREQPRTIQW